MDAFLDGRNMSDVFTGLVAGSVYGLIGLGLVLIWRATRVLNFALGTLGSGGAYLGLAWLSYGLPFWWCFVLAVPGGMLLGAVTERTLARPLYGKPELTPIVAMVGLLFLGEAVLGAVWGTYFRPVNPPLSIVDFHLGNGIISLSPLSLFQILTSLGLALAIGLLFRFTNLGLQLRASALAPEVSRLLGVRVGRMLTVGWMLACGIAAIAAVIISAGFDSGLTPAGMEGPFAVGFIAAAVGGLESPTGAMVGGIALGILEQFVSDYYNSNLVLPYTLVVLVIVLVVRPQGLFSRTKVRRV